nr:diguanylate cyclase [Rhizobiaceae bacterium]
MSMFRRSVAIRFLAVFVPAFLVVALGAMNVVVQQRVASAEDHIAARIGSGLGRAAAQIDRSALGAGKDGARRVLAQLSSDPAVVCADLLLAGTVAPDPAYPRNLGCTKMRAEAHVSVPAGDRDLSLRVGYSLDEVRAVSAEARQSMLALAALAVLVASLVAVVAFRFSVGRPLESLLGTVRLIAKDGMPRQAEVSGSDEVAQISSAFNVMQDRLADERSRTRQMLERINRLYNKTPSLLFLIDDAGVLLTASDHWLSGMGYRRTEVTGRSLGEFLAGEQRNVLEETVLATLRRSGSLKDVPLKLIHRDATQVDVLLSAERDEGGHYVCAMTDVTLLRIAEQSLRTLALTDPLTGLPNRLALSEWMDAKRKSGASMHGLTAIYIDLDDFKVINDTYGHSAGDRVLRESASRISNTVGECGLVARLGGDEFAVVFDTALVSGTAISLARNLIARLREPITLNHSVGQIGASIGIATSKPGKAGHGDVLLQADQAMYLAKRDGKNGYAFYRDAMSVEILNRMRLGEQLRK